MRGELLFKRVAVEPGIPLLFGHSHQLNQSPPHGLHAIFRQIAKGVELLQNHLASRRRQTVQPANLTGNVILLGLGKLVQSLQLLAQPSLLIGG